MISADYLEKRSTTFSSRYARFQLEITYLVVKNEDFQKVYQNL